MIILFKRRKHKCFKFYVLDQSKHKWVNHKGIQNLEEVLNLKETCGYVTFINTGVPDIGCEQYDTNVHLIKPKRFGTKERRRASQSSITLAQPNSNMDYIVSNKLNHFKNNA